MKHKQCNPSRCLFHRWRKYLRPECHIFNMQAGTSEFILWQITPRWKQTLYIYIFPYFIHLVRTGFTLKDGGEFAHLSHIPAFCSTLYMFRLVDKTVALMQKTCAGVFFSTQNIKEGEEWICLKGSMRESSPQRWLHLGNMTARPKLRGETRVLTLQSDSQNYI